MATDPSTSRLSTAQVARMAGVHRDTLLRWLRAGIIPEPRRDRHGWRFFDEAQANAVVKFASTSETPIAATPKSIAPSRVAADIERLRRIDWDFSNAKTNYLTHGLHPYPAKYIPQIPNALIQELSVTGETVADIFCGSGTTLVEALTLKRNAVGIDANPLACLISRVKTTPLDDGELLSLANVADHAETLAQSLSVYDTDTLFGAPLFRSVGERPSAEDIGFWFDDFVIEELAEARHLAHQLRSDPARDVALMAFSSVIVAVSKQDSDTRYVRREKQVRPGDTLKRFARALRDCIRAIAELSDICEPRFGARVIAASLLDKPAIPELDLVVCSPPYPNAYSYHLYHRTRMVWLGMDQPRFKRDEIGSHRKYSSKGRNAATVATFEAEMSTIFGWLRQRLRRDRFACFVVGDSTIAGHRVNNADLLSTIALRHEFVRAALIERRMQDTKKAFNPAIGKIKTESILILQNAGGAVL